MKFSKDKIIESIQLYLNDLSDYGEEGESDKAESVLDLKTTLEEGEYDVRSLLKETAKKSPENKQIILEFIEYLQNI